MLTDFLALGLQTTLLYGYCIEVNSLSYLMITKIQKLQQNDFFFSLFFRLVTSNVSFYRIILNVTNDSTTITVSVM